MFDNTLTIHLLASTIAIAASYGFLMSILKKEPSVRMLHGTALITLVCSGVAGGVGYVYLFGAVTMLQPVSVMFLLLGLAGALALVVIHKRKVKSAEMYPTELLSTAKVLGVLTFSSLSLHMVLFLASIANAV